MPSLEQRKSQNRAAQQKFRRKKKELERQLAVRNEELKLENANLKAQLECGKMVVQPPQQFDLRDVDPDPHQNVLS
jgi:hypothetical protein